MAATTTGVYHTAYASELRLRHTRAERAGVTLSVDDQLSGHYVEVRGGPSDQPLSSEHPIS